MKVLFAVITCAANTAKANAQRGTWVPLVRGADVKFFLARQDREPLSDEVFLNCDDTYYGLPTKVRAAVTWALGHGYELVLRLDDDAYCFPDRLMVNLPTHHYVGHVNETPPTWCSGFAYWIDRKAMSHIFHAAVPAVNPDDPSTWAEDRWVGTVLREGGIEPAGNPDFVVADVTPRTGCITPTTQVACEFDETTMFDAHRVGREVARKRGSGRRPTRGDGTPFP